VITITAEDEVEESALVHLQSWKLSLCPPCGFKSIRCNSLL